tara:strand:+ start:3527 stop:7105 length:3579 start_codon:yes stop_codon:yes gene_type:complete
MNEECSNLDILITADIEVSIPNGQHSYTQLRELNNTYQKTLSSISLWSKIILPENISISVTHACAYLDLSEVIRACKKHWNDSELLLILNSVDFSDNFSLPELLEETGCKLEIQFGKHLRENYTEIELIKKLVKRWQRAYYFNVVFSEEHDEIESSISFFNQFKRYSESDKSRKLEMSLNHRHLSMRNGDIYYPCRSQTKKTKRKSGSLQNRNSPDNIDKNVGIHSQRQPSFDLKITSKNEKIKIGFCIPTMSMGGVTRSLLTMMNVTCAHDLEWSGFAIGSALAFDPETASMILEHCPIYSSMDHPDFKGLVTIVGNACQTIIHQSDVVNLWGYSVPNRELEISNWKKKPMLIVAHGQNEWTRKNIQTSLRYAGQSILVSVSQSSIQCFPEHLRKNVKVIYNGIDFNRCTSLLSRNEIRKYWGISSDKIAIGYIGRFTNGKNVFAAAQAVSVLGQGYHAVYVGEGLGNDHVISHVKELCGKQCSFMPRTEDIGSVLSGLDCLVSASSSEGGPLTVSEAWAAGCPVVSTSVGFIPELEEKYGQLVFSLPDDPTPDQLAIEVKKAIKPGSIVQRAREVACKEFSAKQMAKGYGAFISAKLSDKQVDIQSSSNVKVLDDTGIVIDARSHSLPKVSVVMPVYNSEKYIGESLESIRNQSFQDYELIIVHDGSTDDTLAIMLAHLERLEFDNFLLITQPNSGTGAALNKGFQYVRGEYSTWWSADSNMNENFLTELHAALDSSDNVDFVYANYSVLYEETGVIQDVQVPDYDSAWLQNNCYIGVCWLWKHSLKNKAGDYQLAICEDYDMHLRMAELGIFKRAQVSAPLAVYRNHPDNLTNRISKPRGYAPGRHVSWKHAWRKASRKIAYICANRDHAGIGWFHVEGIYENLPDTAARQVLGKSTHLQQLGDLIIGEDDVEIKQMLDECDLIHINGLLPDDHASLLDVTPWLDRGKPVIFHMHGGHWPWDRQKINVFRETYNATLVSCTPGIEKLYPGARWMPNYMPISQNGKLREERFFYPREDWESLADPISVGFYHNYGTGKGADLITLTQPWIEKELGLLGLFNLECRDNSPIPLREHLPQKKKHDVVIDNITQGFIGMAGWEAMAQGQVLLARLDEYAVREYAKLGDGQLPPIVNVAWWDELAVFLIEMHKDPEALINLKQRSRDWMLKYYHAERILQHWECLYLGVLDGIA